MDNKCTREVIALHQFFEGWLKGELPKDQSVYTRFVNVVGAGFVLISPNGTLTEREPLLKSLYEAHSSRQNFRIWIEKPQLHHQHGDITVITYEEWQEIDGKMTARLSTAIFCDSSSAPNGVVWLHVHETWMPEHQP